MNNIGITNFGKHFWQQQFFKYKQLLHWPSLSVAAFFVDSISRFSDTFDVPAAVGDVVASVAAVVFAASFAFSFSSARR